MPIRHRLAGPPTHHGDPLVAVPRVRRGHRDNGLAKRLGKRLRRRARSLLLLHGHRRAIPTAGCNVECCQHARPAQPGSTRQLFVDALPQGTGQDDWPESFFKIRLATVSSPMTRSRSSSWAFSSRISRSRLSLPFLPVASAPSPAARNSSRQRYSVCSLMPKRRATCTAGSSRRSKTSTASRRCCTVNSERLGMVESPPGSMTSVYRTARVLTHADSQEPLAIHDVTRGWNHHRWKAIRDFLSARGHIDWQDHRYEFPSMENGKNVEKRPKRGIACKWAISDDFNWTLERVSSLNTSSKGGTSFVDTEIRRLVLTQGKGQNLRPKPFPIRAERERLFWFRAEQACENLCAA